MKTYTFTIEVNGMRDILTIQEETFLDACYQAQAECDENGYKLLDCNF